MNEEGHEWRTLREGVEEKSNDEAETETEGDEEGKKDTEVEYVAIVTSESTSWTIRQWGVHLKLSPDAVYGRTSIVVHGWKYIVRSPSLQMPPTVF